MNAFLVRKKSLAKLISFEWLNTIRLIIGLATLYQTSNKFINITACDICVEQEDISMDFAVDQTTGLSNTNDALSVQTR